MLAAKRFAKTFFREGYSCDDVQLAHLQYELGPVDDVKYALWNVESRELHVVNIRRRRRRKKKNHIERKLNEG